MLEFFLCPLDLAEMTRNTYSLLHNHFPPKSVWEGKKTGLLLAEWEDQKDQVSIPEGKK